MEEMGNAYKSFGRENLKGRYYSEGKWVDGKVI
jgi:hypothetical protein